MHGKIFASNATAFDINVITTLPFLLSNAAMLGLKGLPIRELFISATVLNGNTQIMNSMIIKETS